MTVLSFTLINTDTGAPVIGYDPIADGATINLDEVGYNLSIRANVDTCAVGVGSVAFSVNDAALSVDNDFPYTIKGDTAKPDCRYLPWNPTADEYTILATPYSGINSTGMAGTPASITITFEMAGAVPAGIDGWTPAFTETGDTVKIYVSTSGSDSNDGSSGSPYATLAKAMSVLRDGMPDWIYLKRGDTWHEDFSLHYSGKSETEPKLITYYGSGNPPQVDGAFSVSTARNVDHLAIVGVRFWRMKKDPDDGSFDLVEAKKFLNCIRLNAPMDDVLIEGCQFGFGDIEIINDISNFRFRRNVHAGNYVQNPAGAGNGLKAYCMYVSNRGNPFVVEENIFDYGGWNATVAGASRPILGHNCYFDSGSGAGLVRRNIAVRGSDQGLMLRCGGVLDDNLLVECAVGCLAGSRPSKIINNVCLSGADFSVTEQRGYGPESHAPPVVLIDSNIIANKLGGVGGGDALTLQYRDTRGWHAGDPPITLPVAPQITVTSNTFFNWHGSLRAKIYDGTLTVEDNRFVDSSAIPAMNLDYTTATLNLNRNKFYSTASGSQQMKLNGSLMSFSNWVLKTGDGSRFVTTEFVDDTATLETYFSSISGDGTLDSFMAAALAMWRENWVTAYTAPEVNDFVRAGFVEV